MSVPKYTKSDEERLAREIAADDDFYDEYSMGWDAGERIERERIVRRLNAIVADNVVPEAIYDLLRELGWPLP